MGEFPDAPMSFVFRHFWALGILVTCANAVVWWWRGRAAMSREPKLESGYKRLIRGWLFWGNLPWLWIGLAELGGYDGVFQDSLFHPQLDDPVVVGWFALVILEWVLLLWWLFAREGAEQLVRHPGLLGSWPLKPSSISAGMIRIYAVLAIAGGIVGLVLFWSQVVTHD